MIGDLGRTRPWIPRVAGPGRISRRASGGCKEPPHHPAREPREIGRTDANHPVSSPPKPYTEQNRGKPALLSHIGIAQLRFAHRYPGMKVAEAGIDSNSPATAKPAFDYVNNLHVGYQPTPTLYRLPAAGGFAGGRLRPRIKG